MPIDEVEEEIDAPEEAAQPAQPVGRDPYAQGPTGYTGFQTYANNNAQASKASAAKVNTKVASAGDAATQALTSAYGAFQQAGQDARTKQAMESTDTERAVYAGPGGFDPSAELTQQYGAAAEQRNQLGGAGGVGALMGPRTSRFGAALTYGAGQDDFEATRGRYAGLDTAIGAAEGRGQEYVGNLKKPMTYQEIVNLQNRERGRQYTANASAAAAREADARTAEAERDRIRAEEDAVYGAERGSDPWRD